MYLLLMPTGNTACCLQVCHTNNAMLITASRLFIGHERHIAPRDVWLIAAYTNANSLSGVIKSDTTPMKFPGISLGIARWLVRILVTQGQPRAFQLRSRQ